MGLFDGFLSLGAGVNKAKGKDDEKVEGVSKSLMPELDLEMPDEDLLALTKNWKAKWDTSKIKTEWIQKTEENEKYWLGKQFSDLELQNHALVDNAIFEALETFLPQATRRNPEPSVELADGDKNAPPEALEFADSVEKKLIDLADQLKLRLKIKKAARHWSIYLLGVGKVGWSLVTDNITFKIIRASTLVLDPDGVTDEDGYSGKYIGEPRTDEAALLVKRFPKAEKYITDSVQGKMGTDVTYMEWWTDEYLCWTLKDEVLGKTKNPHWNYDSETQQTFVDDFGVETAQTVPVPGQNHFPTAKKPYVFLSIFNLGKGPVDETSLISQNLSLQDLVNKRLRQTDKNADSQNNGMVISLEKSGLNKEQAAGAAEALRKGGVIAIPAGNVQEANKRDAAPQLPTDVYNQLIDARTRLADVFGTRGSTASGIQKEDTVRGKIITRGLDTDRIGGGITEYLEQFADEVFNWFVQMMFVYYPDFQGVQAPKLRISVKEGSLLPKDNVTQANQAIELWGAGALDPITLFEKLEYPNPKETAKNLYLWMNAPQMLFQDDPEIQQLVAQQQAAAQAEADKAAQGDKAKLDTTKEVAQMNNDAKLQQIQTKAAGDLLTRVPPQ
jgi:hypothetical protein